MAAGRVPDENDPRQIETMLLCKRTNMIDGLAHVQIRVRPAAACLIHPAVFDIQCRDSTALQGIGYGCEVGKRAVGLETPAVDQRDDRMWTSPARHPQLRELIRVSAIGHAFVRRLRRN